MRVVRSRASCDAPKSSIATHFFPGSFSLTGTLYGVLASLFVSLYAIYIKRILPVVDNNVWLLTFYNNVNAMLLFIPLMLVMGEFPVIFSFKGIFSWYFWFLMTLGGVFGCAIGYVTGLQVKVKYDTSVFQTCRQLLFFL